MNCFQIVYSQLRLRQGVFSWAIHQQFSNIDFPLFFCLSPTYVHCQQAHQTIPMCFVSQRSVFSSSNPHRIFLSALPYIVVPTSFLRLFASLGATYQHVVGKCLPWNRSLLSRRLTSEMPPYLLICTRPGRVIQDSASHEICSKTRLSPESNFPTNNYASLRLSVSVL